MYEDFRNFLKDSIQKTIDFLTTDQNRGIGSQNFPKRIYSGNYSANLYCGIGQKKG